MSYYNISEMYLRDGKTQLAAEALRQAENFWTRLTNLHPSVTSYRFDLGTVHYRMADVERQLKHFNEAHAQNKKAMEIFNQLVKVEPDRLDHQIYQGWARNLEGVIYDDERRNDLACRSSRRI